MCTTHERRQEERNAKSIDVRLHHVADRGVKYREGWSVYPSLCFYQILWPTPASARRTGVLGLK